MNSTFSSQSKDCTIKTSTVCAGCLEEFWIEPVIWAMPAPEYRCDRCLLKQWSTQEGGQQ